MGTAGMPTLLWECQEHNPESQIPKHGVKPSTFSAPVSKMHGSSLLAGNTHVSSERARIWYQASPANLAQRNCFNSVSPEFPCIAHQPCSRVSRGCRRSHFFLASVPGEHRYWGRSRQAAQPAPLLLQKQSPAVPLAPSEAKTGRNSPCAAQLTLTEVFLATDGLFFTGWWGQGGVQLPFPPPVPPWAQGSVVGGAGRGLVQGLLGLDSHQ